MAAGDQILRYLQCATLFGVARVFTSAAAFTAAGWNLTFKDLTGTILSPQPTWTIAYERDGMHVVSIAAEPSGTWYAVITVPTSDWTPQLVLTGLGEAYDNSDLASLILGALGTGATAGSTATTGRLDDWIEGDTLYRTGLVIPQWAIDAVGASGLTDVGLTIQAGIKKPFPTKQSADVEAATITVQVTDPANRVVKLDTAWNTALLVGSGVERQPYKLDISLKKTTRRVTANRYDIDVVWQADTQT